MAEATPQQATAEDVSRLAGKLEGWSSLCGLFDGRRRACEAETMVAQTICAAVINTRTYGEPFSFVDPNVHSFQNGGIVDNGTAYGWLVGDGFFIESERNEKPVIFPTQKLVTVLDEHLKKGGTS